MLLTGASGFLGWHAALQGVAAGVEVHCLGRSPGPAGTRFHLTDLTNREAVAACVAEVAPEGVIHCAAPGVSYGSMSFAEMLEVAVGGSEALYAACAAQDTPPAVVHVGSGFEYAPSDLPVPEGWPIVPASSLYGAAKAASTAIAGGFADRLRIMLLRPFHIYGAGESERRLGPHIIARTKAGDRVELTAGEQRRDFLHVDDCARCLWTALAQAPQTAGLTTLNLGSGTAIPLRAFIEALADELGRSGMPADLVFGALPYRANEPMVSLPDTSRVMATLAWRPRISLEQGIEDLVKAELAR